MRVAAVDEKRHQPDGKRWREAHQLAIIGSGDQVVVFRLTFWPEQDVAEFLAVRAGADERTVVLHDTELPVPDRRWELRSSGIWVELVCETPLLHWSYGLEAFALAIDAPHQLFQSAVGERVPIGWELEFESRESPEALDGFDRGYQQTGIAHGILLDAAGQTPVQGSARRWHWWGQADLATTDFAASEHSTELANQPSLLAAVAARESRLGVFASPGHITVGSPKPQHEIPAQW